MASIEVSCCLLSCLRASRHEPDIEKVTLSGLYEVFKLRGKSAGISKIGVLVANCFFQCKIGPDNTSLFVEAICFEGFIIILLKCQIFRFVRLIKLYKCL